MDSRQRHRDKDLISLLLSLSLELPLSSLSVLVADCAAYFYFVLLWAAELFLSLFTAIFLCPKAQRGGLSALLFAGAFSELSVAHVRVSAILCKFTIYIYTQNKRLLWRTRAEAQKLQQGGESADTLDALLHELRYAVCEEKQ